MATIRPFCPLRPNPAFAADLIFGKIQRGTVAGNGMTDSTISPLKALLEADARERPENEEGQMQAFAGIRAVFHDLVDSQRLWKESTPGIYVYEIRHEGRTHTGVWALTALEDYKNGTIRIHEHTLDDSVRRLKNYREQTSLECSPVLLTYRAKPEINAIIETIKQEPVKMALENSNILHRVWKVDNIHLQDKLVQAFREIEYIYLADGHHRLESAEQLANSQMQRRENVYDSISSLYMSTDELHIEPYDRFVLNAGAYDSTDLLNEIGSRFNLIISKNNHPVRPKTSDSIGMRLGGQWYYVSAKPGNLSEMRWLAPEILQHDLLSPVFGITDPKNDRRLICSGGTVSMSQIEALYDRHPDAIAFTLPSLTVDELVAAAEARRVLPPKATWILPKVVYGLLIHKHDYN